MTITPVTPVDRERLVPVNTGLLIDAVGEGVAQVVVDSLVTWNGASAQGGWSAVVIPFPGGSRLVLDPPAPFTSGQVVSVVVGGTVTTSLSYLFQCGLEQVTNTDDARSPATIQAGPSLPPLPPQGLRLTFDELAAPSANSGTLALTLTSDGAPPTYGIPGVVERAIGFPGSGSALAVSSGTELTPIYQRTFTVTSAAVLTGAVVELVVDTSALVASGVMDADAGVQFLAPDNSVCPYWIESGAGTATTRYWLKLASVPVGSSTLRMRYGPGLGYGAAQAPESVFLFFDTFNGSSVDDGRWNVVGSGFSVDSGDLVGGVALGGSNYVISDSGFTTPVVARAVSSETVAAPNGFTTIGFWNSTGDNVTILSHSGTSFYSINGGWTNFGFSGLGVGDVVDEVTMTGTQARVVRQKTGQTYDSGFFAYTQNGEKLFLGARQDFSNYGPQAYSCRWRHVFVRPYSQTQPTIAVFGADVTVGLSPVIRPVTPDPLRSQSFSIAGWLRADAVGAQRTLASLGRGAGRGWALKIGVDGRLRLSRNGTVIATGNTAIVPGSWTHVAASLDTVSGYADIFVNGESDVTTTSVSTTPISYVDTVSLLDDMWIARDPESGTGEDFSGAMDDWRYFHTQALGRAEASYLWQLGAGAIVQPWLSYARDGTGFVHMRKAVPLTAETAVVPGNAVDLGYNPERDEIEALYVHNGKVFVAFGAPSDTPSTLTQPSVLKDTVVIGAGPGGAVVLRAETTTFAPVKLAVPTDAVVVGAGPGESRAASVSTLPPSPPAVAVYPGPGLLASVFVPASSEPLAVAVRVYRRTAGSVALVTEIPQSLLPQVVVDSAFVADTAYFATLVYGDPGAPSRRRETGPGRQGQVSATTAGDLVSMSFDPGGAESFLTRTQTFSPLKIAVPTDAGIATYGPGSISEYVGVRSWYGNNVGTQAQIASTNAPYALVTGLQFMERKNVGLNLVMSGSAELGNNGSFPITSVVSTSSVVIFNPYASTGSRNISWSLSWANVYAQAQTAVLNTQPPLGIG